MSSTPVIELDSTPDLEAAREYSYSVKIINPAQKKGIQCQEVTCPNAFLEVLKEHATCRKLYVPEGGAI